ncbi:MAG TPA: hypothetical protein VN285_09245 [Candidatus Deferrimicrobium sp.]|nr:hypothetical protein [Candidatus Deferrimicrobium sp.]
MSKPFENIWILSIALILGFLLWLHVATDKTYNYRLALPVVVVELGDRLTLADSPADSVTVLVSATGKQLLRRQWRHRGVRILAAHLPVGRHAFGLTPSNTLLVDPGDDIMISEIIAPKSVQLNVDQIGKAQVKVIPNIEAVAADGYVVRPIYEPDPPVVSVAGARLRIKHLGTVSTEATRLTGLRESLRIIVPLVRPVDFSMTLEPESVAVTIEVVPATTRVFAAVPIQVRNAPSGASASTEPPAVEIELAGVPQEIDTLSPTALTAWTDFMQLDAESRSSIRIDCPPGMVVRRTSAASARIFLR